MLFSVCCLLFGNACFLFVVCVLFVVCWFLVVDCSLFVVEFAFVCRSLFVAPCALSGVCCLLHFCVCVVCGLPLDVRRCCSWLFVGCVVWCVGCLFVLVVVLFGVVVSCSLFVVDFFVCYSSVFCSSLCIVCSVSFGVRRCTLSFGVVRCSLLPA